MALLRSILIYRTTDYIPNWCLTNLPTQPLFRTEHTLVEKTYYENAGRIRMWLYVVEKIISIHSTLGDTRIALQISFQIQTLCQTEEAEEQETFLKLSTSLFLWQPPVLLLSETLSKPVILQQLKASCLTPCWVVTNHFLQHPGIS